MPKIVTQEFEFKPIHVDMQDMIHGELHYFIEFLQDIAKFAESVANSNLEKDLRTISQIEDMIGFNDYRSAREQHRELINFYYRVRFLALSNSDKYDLDLYGLYLEHIWKSIN